MDVQNASGRFNQAVSCLSPRLKALLTAIPSSAKQTVFEIRLRVSKPIMLQCAGRSWFVDNNSQLLNLPKMPYYVTQNDISDSIVSMCSHSVHSHQQEFKNGFISLNGGHRAGICGTAVLTDDKISAIRDITSVNLRIAHEVVGAADKLMEEIFYDEICSVLVIGIPASGKTTLLRDLTRQLASGKAGRLVKVAVVDERCEIAAVYNGKPQNDLGYSSDILSGYPKASGIQMALRTMSPQVIVCDEIGDGEEASKIMEGLNAGVKIIATAHASSIKELLLRPQLRKLVESGAFDKIVRLGGAENPGEIRQITKVGGNVDKARGNHFNRTLLGDDGSLESVGFIESGLHA